VRLEALRALSFFPSLRSFDLAVRVVEYPLDRELRYTLESTLGALRPVWEAAAKEGVDLAGDNDEIAQLMARVASNDFVEQQAAAWMKRLANTDNDIADNAAERILRLADLHGSRRAGVRVFRRSCHACHRVGDEGADYGPNLSDVGIRLRRHEIIESIVDPNATIDDKYKATNVITVEGKIHSGLVTRDDAQGITLVLGDGKVVEVPHDDIDDRQQVDVSSMPGGLHEAMSASEFLDLAAYLSAQKTPPRDAAQ
jgi:putative heme-binding domain-containing protein